MLLRSDKARSGNQGAFTTRKAAVGETLCTWAMPLVVSASLDENQARYSVLVYDNLVMPPTKDDASNFTNHSCEPSAAVRFALLDRGSPFAVADLIALKNLEEGEEVTFDYASVMMDERFSFPCRCGSGSCRGRVSTWRTLPVPQRKRLLGSPAVLRSLATSGFSPLPKVDKQLGRIGLDGRRILIIGGTGGIGSACVLAAAKAGAAAVGLTFFLQPDRALELVRQAEADGVRAFAVHADLASEASIRAAVGDVAAAFGGLDGLVCAGGLPFDLHQWNRTLEDVDLEFSSQAFRVDALGTLAALKAAVPALAASGSGRVVLMASTPPLTGDTVGFPYLLAKAAVIALGRSAAQALGPRGILVNTLALGHIETAAMGALPEIQAKELRDGVALARGGSPEDVASQVVFLLSDGCAFMTGATMPVDGGYAGQK